jgi:hypothetical protein
MRRPENRISTVRRVANMIAVWVLIGGIVGSMGKAGLVAGAIGGMIVCSVLGILAGLIGGDTTGTVIGASSLGIAAVSGAPIGVEFGIMFGGLLGTTLRPWLRTAYRLLIGVCFVFQSLTRRFGRAVEPRQPAAGAQLHLSHFRRLARSRENPRKAAVACGLSH